MKFFTKEWWFGDDAGDDAVFERYRDYISSVRDHLPRSLLDLHEQHTLHDSALKRMALCASGGTLELELVGWDVPLQQQVRYTLLFSGVARVDLDFPESEHVEQKLGDLGYWECEYLGPEIEMRMLFSTETTFTVRFSDFAFQACADGTGELG